MMAANQNGSRRHVGNKAALSFREAELKFSQVFTGGGSTSSSKLRILCFMVQGERDPAGLFNLLIHGGH